MCWSFAASIIFTTIGLLASIYLVVKKDDPNLWIGVFYFSLMELLQVFTYLFIDQCGLPINQLLTYLGYLHIVFQPFFANMIIMHFIPTKVRSKIKGYVYAVCFATAIVMLVKIYPFDWAQSCRVGIDLLCGTKLCSVSGQWHLAWLLPLKNIGWIFNFAYIIPAFILPMIYGGWKPNLIHILLGPALISLFVTSPNEFPAVWCLFSILIILLVFIPKFRKRMYVKKWYFWEYPKFMKKKR